MEVLKRRGPLLALIGGRMRFLKTALFAFVLFLAGGLLFAQGSTAPPDWKPLIAQIVTAATPFAVFYIVKGVKAILPKIPSWIIPLAAMAIGFGLTALAGVVVSPSQAWYLGPLLGALAVIGNEIQKAITEKGWAGNAGTTVLFRK